jgi:hypothetical protein
MHRSLCLLPLLMILPALPAAADSPPTCVVRLDGMQCPNPDEAVTWRAECPEQTFATHSMFACPKIGSPPPAQLYCDSANGVVECEAWPQSPQLTYRYVYSVLNGVAPNYTVSEFSPRLLGNCTGNSGRVAVTVIAPNGASSTAQTLFPCLQNE